MKTTISSLSIAFIAACAVGLLPFSAKAAPIQTTTVANADGTIGGVQQFPLSANLLTTASANSVNYLDYGQGFGGPATLTDLSLGDLSNQTGAFSYQNYSVTYALNLTGAAKGFNLTNLKVITGGQSNSAGQFYTVSYELLGSNTFTTLGSFGAPQDTSPTYFYFQALQTSITDSTGTLASGIEAIRFDLSGGSTFREIEAFGAPAVPEPSTWISMVMGLGILGFLVRRRSLKSA